MNELSIELTDINPREFFGQNQETITLIKAHFVKLKIVARGNVIKAYGEEAQLNDFQEKIEQLTSHYARYNQMNEQIIGMVLAGDHQTAPKEFAAMDQVIVHGINGKVITAKSVNQRKIVSSAELNDLVFAIGPAGTGKTYTSVALAVRALKDKQVKRIILTRPAVEAGENLGFLPGDLKEKLDPYMQPLYDALRDMIPPEKLQLFIETGVIQIAPLAFMRGRTLDNAFVILDEAQNTTHAQMKMFLTRMGKHAKFMITGDPGQVDLPRRITSGLKEALLILKDIKGVGMVYLDDKDVIRHKLVKEVISAYNSIENHHGT